MDPGVEMDWTKSGKYTAKTLVLKTMQSEELENPTTLSAEIGPRDAGKRLDQALAHLFPDFSRSRLQDWVRQGRVLVQGAVRRPRDKVLIGERLVLTPAYPDQVECRPQAIPLEILFEDEHLLVIHKPAGLVVHPAAGNPDGTLQNALLYHDEASIRLPRAGIVHRLDKETSGLMVVARSALGHKRLVDQLQARTVKREYLAVAQGVLISGGTVDEPIGRHPRQRTRMAVVADGKPAVTHYRVLERYRGHTLLQVNLETGRTHQIRVHMAHLLHPLAGDPQYGGRLRLPKDASPALQQALREFNRQALHARKLALIHPASGETMEWEAAPPQDMQQLIETLRADSESPELQT